MKNLLRDDPYTVLSSIIDESRFQLDDYIIKHPNNLFTIRKKQAFLKELQLLLYKMPNGVNSHLATILQTQINETLTKDPNIDVLNIKLLFTNKTSNQALIEIKLKNI